MPPPDTPPSLLARLASRHAAGLLARNTIVSVACFLFDLALLWAMVRWLGMDRTLAVGIGFVIATSIHYAVGRLWIFVGSRRGMATGYALFFVNAGVGLVLTVALFALFSVWLPLLAARVLASVFAGLAAFLLNAVLNFKSV